MATSFTKLYDQFLSSVTDDMFMEITSDETQDILKEVVVRALYHFEFPRVNIMDYDVTSQEFVEDLTNEEINIIVCYMVVEWIGYQLASIENIRQKYSGSDFKFTSQASHIDKLQKMKTHYTTEGFHLQRLYKRRKLDNGKFVSAFDEIME